MQNHQADSPLYMWPDVWSADLHLFIKNMVIHDIECPYWDQMSLNNTNQTKPNQTLQVIDKFPANVYLYFFLPLSSLQVIDKFQVNVYLYFFFPLSSLQVIDEFPSNVYLYFF